MKKGKTGSRSQESGVRSQKAETTSTAKDAKGAKVELLPCPFCGGAAVAKRFNPNDETPGCWWAVDCVNDSAHAHERGVGCPVTICVSGDTLEDAARCWNTRVPLRASAPQREPNLAEKLLGTVRVRYYGGGYIAKVRVGTTTYRASSTCGEDQAAEAVAAKVQTARCAERVTLSVGTPGADTGPEFAKETHYLLTVFEGAEGGAA